MTRPRRRPQATAEDIAVPRWNPVDAFMEGLGLAAAAAGPHERVRLRPRPEWRALHPPPQAPEPKRVRGPIYIYPWINRDMPWGCASCSPMGEGSEDTAVPAVDPAEARLHPEELHLVASEPEEPGEAILEEKERRAWPRRFGGRRREA